MGKILGQSRPIELDDYDDAVKKLDIRAISYFNFWTYCQAWDGAGDVKLETVERLCEDYGLNFDKWLRMAIYTIKNSYWRVKNG